MRVQAFERYHCAMGLSKNAAPQAVGGTSRIRILRVGLERRVEEDDRVAVEAPLEFQLHHPNLGMEPVSFGTTMRTPGDDESLARVGERNLHQHIKKISTMYVNNGHKT